MADAVRTAILSILAERGPTRTACPSEAARRLATPDEDWRDHMGAVHAAVDGLLAEGQVALSWRGQPLRRRTGPYRIALRSPIEPE